MSKKETLKSICDEILSRSILSQEDIESIILSRLDFLLTEIAKNKLNSYEKRQRKLLSELKSSNSKRESKDITNKLQKNKLMKKQFNIIHSESVQQSNYIALKKFIRDKGDVGLLDEFYSTINK